MRSQGMEGGRHRRSQLFMHLDQDHLDDHPHHRVGLQVTVDGNTMVHVQKGDSARGEKDTKIVRLAKNRPGKISLFKNVDKNP